MPFPFNRLPWGEQYRLRNLMTPSELYQMQIALGRTKNYLGPLQPTRISENDCKLIRNEPHNQNAQSNSKLVYDERDTEYYNENDVIIIKNLFVADCTLEIDSKIPRFIHPNAILHIEHLKILFQKIKITASVMKQFASLCSKDCIWFNASELVLEPDVTMPLIFTLFPNLKHLELYVDHTDTWLDDLLEIKANCLEDLHVYLITPIVEAMFRKLNVESLYKLCKAQPPNFKLHFFFGHNDDSHTIEVQVWNFLKPHFRDVKDHKGDLKLHIKVFFCLHMYEFNACYA